MGCLVSIIARCYTLFLFRPILRIIRKSHFLWEALPKPLALGQSFLLCVNYAHLHPGKHPPEWFSWLLIPCSAVSSVKAWTHSVSYSVLSTVPAIQQGSVDDPGVDGQSFPWHSDSLGYDQVHGTSPCPFSHCSGFYVFCF